MISTLGLFSPLKKALLRSVRTTSLSTVNWTFLQNSLCSSGLMHSLDSGVEGRGGRREEIMEEIMAIQRYRKYARHEN